MLTSPNSRALLTAAALAAGALGACSGGPAKAPDRDAVVAAQAEWCDGLARVIGGGPSWEHLAECKAAYPTASPGYLRLMTKCFTRRLEAAGDEAPDRSQLVAECNDEVLVHLTEDEAAARDVVEARCARMTRCESVPAAECRAAFAKLDSSQRALFTTAYNAAGRYEVADCLGSASCTDNEEAGREACYKPVAEKLLWFPD
ncbi:MAG: hypothetical protein IT372_20735 [Polyangiaceae bacterium]|nr:hypothetical protein [Polyangiaceae bacterium]